MKFTPTPEQDRILTVATNSKDNLIINALAGAAKTTTLRLLAKKLQKKGTCVAFNKKTAEELKKTFPGYVECATLNSIGHKAWGRRFGGKLNLEPNKILRLMDLAAASTKYEVPDRAEMRRAIDLARNAGYAPRKGEYARVECITGNKDECLNRISDELKDGLDRRERAFLDEVLTRSIHVGLKDGLIDFCDQLYLPTMFGGDFGWVGELLLVDEVQDLSELNHRMLAHMSQWTDPSGTKHTARVIAVGDKFQSIYKFRGSVSNSMEQLQASFGMRELELTTTFRCARSIVRNAQEIRTPAMKWAESAPEGEVVDLEEWGPSIIPAESFILCRNNAPLFDMAKKLIHAGLKFKLVGKDLLAGLTKIIRELGAEDLTTDLALINLKAWADAKRETCKLENREALEDKIESLHKLLKFGKTIREVLIRISYMNDSDGRILLMTGHKAKGLETDTVFHLDPDRIPSPFAIARAEEDPEAMIQEANLRYVIETRPKRRLWRVQSELYDPNL